MMTTIPMDRDARQLSVCRTGDPVPARLRKSVLAIGNFDGVHRGHQGLIAAARRGADAGGLPSAVLTFEPHPRSYFQTGAPLFRLTPEAVKIKILSKLGLDGVFVRRFDAALANLSPEEFISDLVKTEIGASALVVGADFHFGRARAGTPTVLQSLATRSGLSLSLEPTVSVDGGPVSSSRIRDQLRAGEVEAANRLLDYRWFLQGTVLHGDKRGRTLGYPTANMRLDDGCGLAHGIYAVRVAVGPGEVHGGVASFGRRPTFDNGAPLLESYIFDFAGDLYGRDIEVELVGRIRPEERFASAEALVAQMRNDEAEARRRLAAPTEVEMRSFIG